MTLTPELFILQGFRGLCFKVDTAFAFGIECRICTRQFDMAKKTNGGTHLFGGGYFTRFVG